MSNRALLILLAIVFGISIWASIPAWNDCRAAGHSANTCFWSIKYWAAKRFWGF